ncbi:MAG: PAS domain S-box protein [Chloroflexi bacterium]|jgi:two-component system, sporulation sensor kinase E|nr:PAS domain S-box protein [Chloroflexota bacterium]
MAKKQKSNDQSHPGNPFDERSRLHRMIVDHAADAVFVYERVADGGRGEFIETNKAACDMLGYTRAELLKMHPQDIADEAGMEDKLSAIQEQFLNERHVVFNTMHVAKDGRKIPVQISAHLFEIDGDFITLAISHDTSESTESQQKLEASERWYRMIVDSAKDAVLVYDRTPEGKLGKFVDVNKAACDLYGYTREEFLSISPLEISAADNVGYFRKQQEQATFGEKIIVQSTHVSKNGRKFPVEISRSLSETDGRQVAVSIVRDISERQRILQELEDARAGLKQRVDDRTVQLQENSERVTDLISTIHNAVYVYKAVDNANDFVLSEFNHAAEVMEGRSRQEVIGKNLTEFAPKAKNSGLLIALSTIYKTGKHEYYPPSIYKDRHGGPDSWREAWLYKLSSGEIVAEYNVVTELKQSEEALKASEQKTRAILDASPDVIHLIDSNGIILASNEGFAKRMGLELDDVVGTSVFDYGTTESARSRKAALDKVFSTGKPLQLEDEAITGVFESYIYPVSNPAGEISAVAIYARDISERKRAERELLDNEAKFKTISHESLQGIVITKDQTIVYVNPAFEDLFGYTMEKLNALSPEQRIERTYVDDRERIVQYHQERFEGKDVPESIEYRIVRKDETVRWIESRSSTIEFQGGPAILSVCIDTTERKRAEAEIHKLGSAVDQSIDGIAINDHTHKITYANTTYASMHGYSPQELKDITFRDLILGGQGGVWPVIRESVGNTDSWSGEIDHLRKDGTTFPAYISITKLRDDNGQQIGVLSICRDITDRKHAEQSLRESECNLTQAQSMAHIGHWKLDVITQEVEGSDELFRIFGLSSKEATLEAFTGVVHPDDREYDLFHIRRGMETGEPWDIEHRLICKDGTQKHVHAIGEALKDDKGKIVALVGTVQDITDRKRDEVKLKDYSDNLAQMVKDGAQQLADSEEKFRLIVNSTNDAIYVSQKLGDESFRIMEVNQTLSDMLGYSKEEVLNMLPIDLVSPHGAKLSMAAKDSLDLEDHIVYETEFLSKSGKKIPAEVGARLFIYKGLRTIVSIIRDITDRKETAKKLVDAQQRLARSEKLAAIGQMASGIAHELRNPLAVVNNAAYYIKLKMGGNDETLDKHLSIMEKEIFRSSGIIAGLLDFARTREPQLKAVDLNEFVRAVVSGLSIPEAVKLTSEFHSGRLEIAIDTEQIKRVLINMVNNAVQSMPKGGELLIKIELSQGYAQIHITDTGVGISREHQRQIFEPLFTTRSAEGGTGIGLSICKSVIKAHRGDIKVNSSMGKGTTFIIKLPIGDQ